MGFSLFKASIVVTEIQGLEYISLFMFWQSIFILYCRQERDSRTIEID